MKSVFQQIWDEFRHHWISWVILVLALSIGLITINYKLFSDEADNLEVGWLISRGYTLYQDVFSHHFPLPYYWTAAIIAIFGKSIPIARTSVWVFQAITIAIAMQRSGIYLPLALLGLCWAIIRALYLGNLVLYDAFDSAALLLIFSITLAFLNDKKSINWIDALIVGIYSVIAIYSNPILGLPILIAIIFWFSKSFRLGGLFLISAVGLISLFIGLFIISGIYQDFFQSAVMFNLNIYSKYTPTASLISQLQSSILLGIRGLDLFNAALYRLETTMAAQTLFPDENWFPSGLFFRSLVLTSTILMIMKREFRAALYTYVTGVIVYKTGFHVQPFYIIALFVSLYVVCESSSIIQNWGIRMIHIGLRIGMGAAIFILVSQAIFYFYDKSDLLLYKTTFRSLEEKGKILNKWACKEEDVRLIHYPYGQYDHWFSNLEPATRYLFMYPWVAEVALPEVVNQLSRDENKTIVILDNLHIWNQYSSKEYMKPVFDLVHSMYHRSGGPKMYLSDKLAAACKEIGK